MILWDIEELTLLKIIYYILCQSEGCKFDQNLFQNFVRLIPDKLEYSGPIKMLTYTVVDYSMGESEHGSVVVTLKLKRMVSQRILSTYLPSLCILIIAQVRQIN